MVNTLLAMSHLYKNATIKHIIVFLGFLVFVFSSLNYSLGRARWFLWFSHFGILGKAQLFWITESLKKYVAVGNKPPKLSLQEV